MNNEYTSIEELLSDESFLQYCNHSNTESIGKWWNWMGFDLSRVILVMQAIELFNDIEDAIRKTAEMEQMGEEEISSGFRKLMASIDKMK